MGISWDMIAGGFGLFIFGIKFMGDGLKAMAGDSLRGYIDKYTSKPIMAVLVGAFITLLIQSSSATTAITIGLVRSGLMKLEQAAGIVMGANIGTTITAFMIGLKIEEYALFFVFIGACIVSFTSRKKTRYLGEVILGFGLLFYGLRIMGDALKELKDLPQFIEFAKSMSAQPLLALLAGTLLTGLIQSSSAVIGVVQKIYEADGMSLIAAISFVFGSNIGTTITGIFAALGGSLAAKRTAGIHTMFNVVGTLIGMMLLVPFVSLIKNITAILGLSPMMQIAFAHIIFNVCATIIFFPLLKQMCNLIRRIIPGNEPERIDIKIDELDKNLPHTSPATALSVTQNAVVKMQDIVLDNVKEVNHFFKGGKNNSEDRDLITQNESVVNELDHSITDYIMLINKQEISEHDATISNLHLQVIKNLERIGDLAVNLAEFFEMIYEDKEAFSKDAESEIQAMFDQLTHMLNRAMKIYVEKDYSLFAGLKEDENYMDLLEYEARQRHFKRMSDEVCSSTIAGSVYCDILGNLERMGDHCMNIAKVAVEVQ